LVVVIVVVGISITRLGKRNVFFVFLDPKWWLTTPQTSNNNILLFFKWQIPSI